MNSQNIEENIRELQRKFLEIRRMEYVKSVRQGNTGVGATFEALLGKSEDSLEIPDFGAIEIKTRRGYSKSLISLFNAVPMGNTDYEVKRLRDIYGYPDVKDKTLKRLNTLVSASEMVKVGVFYFFRLKLDMGLSRLVLCIYDRNEVLIDDSIYWDFDVLKEKLFRKLNILAVIKAWPNRINGFEYFKYYKMNIYVLKDFNSFLHALELGIVKIQIKIGNHYDESRYGMVCSHGISFAIAENDLDSIFDFYR